MTEILIKRLSKDINLPKYETEGSSGMDLAAHIENSVQIEPGNTDNGTNWNCSFYPKKF